MMKGTEHPRSVYINRDVRRWLEASGAAVVPIPPSTSAVEAAAYFEYIHGLFLHPGWWQHADYTALVQQFLTMAVLAASEGDYFPVWGTCQGMQRIMQWAGGTLEGLQSLRYTKGTHVELQVDRKESRLLSYASAKEFDHLKHEFMPWFNHEYGLPLVAGKTLKGLKILATSHDREGTEYVSMIEGVRLPFYGVQFHPEKKRVPDWMADFFVAEMKKSKHTGFNPAGA